MSYTKARDAIQRYRMERMKQLLGETAGGWFMSAFGGIAEMLKVFSSDDENKEITKTYMSGTHTEKIPPNMRLAYVCGMRREVRKQYVSGPDGIYTDVTPFRHGAMSAQGGLVFDNALNDVMSRKAD